MNRGPRAIGALFILFTVTAARAQDPADSLEIGRRAAAEGRYGAAFEAYRAAVSGGDELAALAGMAGAAAAIGDPPRFLTVLDSIAATPDAGPNALSYWGALSIQAGRSPTGVVDRYDAYLEREGADRGAVSSLFRALAGNGVPDDAARFLDLAEARGAAPADLAMLRGELGAASGDPLLALDAYLVGVRAGGTPAVVAVAALESLLATWPAAVSREEIAQKLALEKDRAAPEIVRLLVPLEVEARIGAGMWDEAIQAAEDPALDLASRGVQLRRIAAAALDESLEGAERALDALGRLGPPALRPADRLLTAELARRRGDHAGAAAELRAAERADVPGAGEGARAAEVAAARAGGSLDALVSALERARADSVDPAAIAVPLGDVWLSRSRPDSAIVSYAAAVTPSGASAQSIEALTRVRTVQWLLRADASPEMFATLGTILIEAPRRPAVSATRLDSLATSLADTDSLGVARALLIAHAAEWRGVAGDPAGASRMLAAASRGAEAPALLLAAGRWAAAAADPDDARSLWRRVVDEYPGTPYALEARRMLAEDRS